VELDIRGAKGVSNIIAFFSPDEAEQVARLMLAAAAMARESFKTDGGAA